MTTIELRSKLVHNLTEYDRKQSTKRHYNRYALGHYLSRIDDIMEDISRGTEPHEAISAGFCGSVLKAALKGTGLKAPEGSEQGGMFYRPVSER